MANIKKRLNNPRSSHYPPSSASDISSIQPSQHTLLRNRIQKLEHELDELYENRKVSAGQTRRLVGSLQQEIKQAKELLANKAKQEVLLRLEGEVVAEECNQTNTLLQEVNRRSAKRFQKRKEINKRKVQLTKEFEKSMKQTERLAVSKRVLQDQLEEMERQHHQIQAHHSQVLKQRQSILKKTTTLSEKCDDQRGILKILTQAHIEADKRNTNQHNLLSEAQKSIKLLQQILHFNSDESQRYNSLTRKQQIKNEERRHHIENRKVEESMLGEEVEAVKLELDEKLQVLRGFEQGIDTLEGFLRQAETERSLYIQTNQEIMKTISDISNQEINVANHIEDSRQSRKDIIARMDRLVAS